MKTADILDRRSSILDRIMERVLVEDRGFILDGKPSPCHIWQGPTSGEGKGGGYGRMSLNAQTVAVHLVVYTHYFGYIPGKKQIDHLCNHRLCCNPSHLEMVTHLRNQRRRAHRQKEQVLYALAA
ncbi:HNH endonuclease signature motif containing protein [Paraburkholderia sp. SIMBA_049]